MKRLIAVAHMVVAFVRQRWGKHPGSRAELLMLQQRRLARFLCQDLGAVPFYATEERHTLDALPIVDKATMLAAFDRFNRYGITHAQALAAAERAEAGGTLELPAGLTAGFSSGTSGARGVFLVSPRERGTWAGLLLATVLSPSSLRQLLMPWAPRLRVVFFLRANSALYTTVNGWRLRLEWLSLTLPTAEQCARLQTLDPQILVAPASVLGTLARAQAAGQLAIQPRQVISVAEVLEDDDARAVEQAWGKLPAQLYQCTEGFLGASCEAGHLHLNEEHLLIEPEWLDSARTRFRPLVTDFTRRSQAFVRFRLDDVLRPLLNPCPCGRPSLALARIEGRSDDRLWLPDGTGCLQPVFPDALRHAIARAQAGWPVEAALQDYRLEQQGVLWLLRTRPALSKERLFAIEQALHDTCSDAGLLAPKIESVSWANEPATAKRRRIRCVQMPLTQNDALACAS